jgi:hypothetical protein
MKNLAILLVFFTLFYSRNSNKTTLKGTSSEIQNSIKNDTIRIANDELEYEIIIIEPGFEAWLATQPPMGHYEISFLENRNRRFVLSYNDRVNNDKSRLIYEQEINYNYTVHYGLEVNYLLYNYFLYFQKTYKQKL